MGPATNVTKGLSPTDPPVFDPASDLQEWRRDVARWVDTIAAAAEKGSDRLYKTVFATLANHLYDRGLPNAQKSIVDEAQAKGDIDYKQDDQIAGVRDIIELIAVDPPIAVVSRLISSFNQVTNCRRRRNEELSTFVSRFRGLSADHLMHGGLSASSQVGEVLAITLLNNANLSEETLTNAKLQLIALAQARDDHALAPTVPVAPETISSLRAFSEKLSKLSESASLKTYRSDTVPIVKRRIHHTRAKVSELQKEYATTVEGLEKHKSTATASVGSRLLRVAPRCRLNLDDAVVVLRNLSFSPSKEAQSYSKSEIENIVGQKVQSALLSFSQTAKGQSSVMSRLGTTTNETKKGGSKRKNKGTKSSKNTPTGKSASNKQNVCYDCGSDDHFRGSDQCEEPSFMTKKIKSEGGYKHVNEDKKEEKSSKSNVNGKGRTPDRSSPFRQGSNPTKRNHH